MIIVRSCCIGKPIGKGFKFRFETVMFELSIRVQFFTATYKDQSTHQKLQAFLAEKWSSV